MSVHYPFVTVTLTYEARARVFEHGQSSKRHQETKQWGWVIKINGLDPLTSFYSLGGVNEDLFRRFDLKQNGEREITCYEEITLSSRSHNQYNPPMTIVTQVLASISALRYINTSSAIAAVTTEGMEHSKSHIPSFMWSFQFSKGPP